MSREYPDIDAMSQAERAAWFNANGGLSFGQLAAMLGVSRNVVAGHLSRLQAAGLVPKGITGRPGPMASGANDDAAPPFTPLKTRITDRRKPVRPRAPVPKPPAEPAPPAPPAELEIVEAPIGEAAFPMPVVDPFPNRCRMAGLASTTCRRPLWADFGYTAPEHKFYCGAPVDPPTESYCSSCRSTLYTRNAPRGILAAHSMKGIR